MGPGIVALGSPGYLRVDGDKAADAMQVVVILGYNHDGAAIAC